MASHPTASRLIFYLLLITAIALRFAALDSQSLWLDEIWSVEIAAGHDADHQLLPVGRILDHPPDLISLASARPVWQICNQLKRITGPPGYYLLLRMWMNLFGQSAISLRSLSAVASVLTLIMFFAVVRSTLGNASALWAAAIFTFSAAQIHHADDARMYCLLLLETVLAVWMAIQISNRGPSAFRTAGLILASVCLLFTHYFAAAVWIAITTYALFFTSGSVRKNTVICMIASGILFAAAWGPMFFRQLPMFTTTDRAAAFLHESGAGHFSRTAWRLLTIPMSLICDIRPIPRWYALGGLWYLLAAVLLLRKKINPVWPILFLCVVGMLAALDLLHTTAHLSFIRYALIASLPVLVTLGCSVRLHKTAGTFLCGIVVLFCLLCLPRAFLPTNENFRDFGQMLKASTRPGDLVIFAGPSDSYAPQILYLAANYYCPRIPGPVLLLDQPATPALLAQLKSRDTLWVAVDPAVPPIRQWIPGYHIVAGKDWPQVGALLELHRD